MDHDVFDPQLLPGDLRKDGVEALADLGARAVDLGHGLPVPTP